MIKVYRSSSAGSVDSWLYGCAVLMGARFFGAIVLSLALLFWGLGELSRHSLAFFVCVFVVCDQLDGMLFRRSSCSDCSVLRSLRRVFDSTIDRVCVQVVNLSLLIVDYQYLPLFLVVLFREVATSLPCVMAYVKGLVLKPTSFSKVSAFSVAVLGFFYLIDLNFAAQIAASVVMLGGCLSSALYYVKFCRAQRGLLVEGRDYELRTKVCDLEKVK